MDSEGVPFIVDVGDCTVGNPALDVVWAEQLLCATPQERQALVECYLDERPMVLTPAEVDEALRGYYSHLHWTLMQSKRSASQDLRTWQAIHAIVERRRTPPTDSVLRERAAR